MERPPWWIHTALVLAATTTFMAVAVWQAWPWWEYAFLSDGSAVSWLSSVLLAACGVVALARTLDGSLGRLLGPVLTTSFAALALDEQFMFHERFKYGYAAPASLDGVPGAIGDVPTLLVGVGGAVLAAVFVRRVRPRAASGLMAAAVLVGLFGLWVDLGRAPALLARTEEAYEVIAESLALCALLEVRRHVHSSSSS